MASDLFAGFGYEIYVSKIESATMKSDDSAFIIYLDIKNTSAKRIKLTLPPTSYTTADGFEVDQDVWLSGFANGVEGVSVKSGAFKRAGLVYFKNKLSKISIGDTLEVRVINEAAGFQHSITLRCNSANSGVLIPGETFSLVSLEDEHYEISANESGIESGKPTEITNLIERLEIIEEKLGIRFEAIRVRARKRLENSPPDYVVEANFDVISGESKLKKSFQPTT